MHQSSALLEKTENVRRNILLLGAEIHPTSSSSLEIVQAPSIASYLSRAVVEDFNLLVLCLFTQVHQERGALIELCGVLRTNRYTREKPLVAVLPGKHRQLLDRLQRVGVKYVMIAEPDGDALQHRLATLNLPLNNNYRIENLLLEICPFINYLPINSCREIILCGAYRNRLVLGPHRLAEICEVPTHLTCEYCQGQEEREPSLSLGGRYQFLL
jgi:hypothetical protein